MEVLGAATCRRRTGSPTPLGQLQQPARCSLAQRAICCALQLQSVIVCGPFIRVCEVSLRSSPDQLKKQTYHRVEEHGRDCQEITLAVLDFDLTTL